MTISSGTQQRSWTVDQLLHDRRLTDINVDDDGVVGTVTIGSPDGLKVTEARRRIELIINPPTAKVGEVYTGRVVNITSTSVKAPLPPLGLSNGARAGLTGFVAGLARRTVRHGVTINNLLPGPFETQRTVDGLAKRAAKAGVPYPVRSKKVAMPRPR